MLLSVHAPSPRPSQLWRGVAILAALLIGFLLIAGVRPEIHERCCHHHASGAVDTSACVVFGFADGVTVSGGLTGLWAPLALLIAVLACGTSPALRAATARLNPPACGPPRTA